MSGWESFSKFVGVQGIMALMLLGLLVYLSVMSMAIPQEILALFSLIVGYYFGKNGRLIVADAQAAKAAKGDG